MQGWQRDPRAARDAVPAAAGVVAGTTAAAVDVRRAVGWRIRRSGTADANAVEASMTGGNGIEKSAKEGMRRGDREGRFTEEKATSKGARVGYGGCGTDITGGGEGARISTSVGVEQPWLDGLTVWDYFERRSESNCTKALLSEAEVGVPGRGKLAGVGIQVAGAVSADGVNVGRCRCGREGGESHGLWRPLGAVGGRCGVGRLSAMGLMPRVGRGTDRLLQGRGIDAVLIVVGRSFGGVVVAAISFECRRCRLC